MDICLGNGEIRFKKVHGAKREGGIIIASYGILNIKREFPFLDNHRENNNKVAPEKINYNYSECFS